MRRRLVVLMAGILALSSSAVLANLWRDERVAAEVDANASVCIRGQVEVHSVAGSLSDAALDDFIALADKGVGDITRFTGVAAPRQRITIYLSPRVGVSHTYPRYPASDQHEPRMFLDSRRVAERSAPYLHELVHAVVGDGGPMWLDEGLAEFVASSVATRFGGYYTPVLSDGNDHVDAQARAVLEAAADAREAHRWFESDDPHLVTQRDRECFYILAHSFTKFLVSTLGTREVVRIRRTGNVDSLAKLSGISIDEWERRWLGELEEADTTGPGPTIRPVL
jgi:hypothetical protein